MSGVRESVPAADVVADLPLRRLAPMQPRTMVDQAAEAIVAAAVSGIFLPGDRLVEAEIARELGISRVPVREALRLLESQGIVVSTPYKGMRLMLVTNRGVAEMMRVRAALEALALREIAGAGPVEEAALVPMRAANARYAALSKGSDSAALVAADEVFHGELCRLSGNAVLFGLWAGLARQLSVVWGLGQDVRPRARTVADHDALLDCVLHGDPAGGERQLQAHLSWHEEVDFEQVIAARRLARDKAERAVTR